MVRLAVALVCILSPHVGAWGPQCAAGGGEVSAICQDEVSLLQVNRGDLHVGSAAVPRISRKAGLMPTDWAGNEVILQKSKRTAAEGEALAAAVVKQALSKREKKAANAPRARSTMEIFEDISPTKGLIYKLSVNDFNGPKRLPIDKDRDMQTAIHGRIAEMLNGALEEHKDEVNHEWTGDDDAEDDEEVVERVRRVALGEEDANATKEDGNSTDTHRSTSRRRHRDGHWPWNGHSLHLHIPKSLHLPKMHFGKNHVTIGVGWPIIAGIGGSMLACLCLVCFCLCRS